MFQVNHARTALTVFNPKPSIDFGWMNEGIDAIRDPVNTSLDEAPMSASNHATSKAIVGAVGR